MGWLEDAKNILEQSERFDAEKSTKLTIESGDDLRDSYVGIKSIYFWSNYSGPSIESVLPDILEKAHDLSSIHITGEELSWKAICSLDLSHIQDLSFSLAGDVTPERLVAPNLKKLSIFGAEELTPIELMLHPAPHIDFSGLCTLEDLKLRHFQQVNPTDFQNVKTLKRVLIFYSDIENLDWLKCASYSLDTLCLDGAIDDCSGVIYQPNLKKLCLYHSYLTDVSPIESLKKLKTLDLRYGTVTNEGNLRSMGIEELAITREDYDYIRLRSRVKDIVRWAVMHYRSQNKKFDKVDELPEFKKRILLRVMADPFEARMQRLVQIQFDRELSRIDKNDKIVGTSILKDDYRKLFVEEALRYCPFVKESSST